MSDWGPTIAALGLYGLTNAADVTLNNACHFNGSLQAGWFNSDGTPKYHDGIPNGAPFSTHAPGTLSIDENFSTYTDGDGNLVYQGIQDDEHQSQVTFKDQTKGTSNLLMPEIKLVADSAEGERNSTNVSAWTGFQRVAGTDDIDLEVVIDFDFFNSSDEHVATLWDTDNIPSIKDYFFSVSFGASLGIANEENVFPEFTDVINETGFSTADLPLTASFEDDPYRGQLRLDLSGIGVGETVYFYSQAQGLGFNGGFVNAFNTVTTKLQVKGIDDEEESNRILASQFTLAPTSVTVPEPSAIALLLSGLGFMAFRRRRSQ